MLLILIGLGALAIMLLAMPPIASVRGWRATLFDSALVPVWLAHLGGGLALVTAGVLLFLRARLIP